MIHITSNLFNFNLKHINAHSFSTLLMCSQTFLWEKGLLTGASCHLSYINHTHNASSTISSISFFEVRNLKDPCKAIWVQNLARILWFSQSFHHLNDTQFHYNSFQPFSWVFSKLSTQQTYKYISLFFFCTLISFQLVNISLSNN